MAELVKVQSVMTSLCCCEEMYPLCNGCQWSFLFVYFIKDVGLIPMDDRLMDLFLLSNIKNTNGLRSKVYKDSVLFCLPVVSNFSAKLKAYMSLHSSNI